MTKPSRTYQSCGETLRNSVSTPTNGNYGKFLGLSNLDYYNIKGGLYLSPTVKFLPEEQVDSAIKSARNAFYTWSDLEPSARIEIFNKFAQLLKDNSETMATVIAKETGKPIWETRTEVGAMAGKIAISIKAHDERTGTTENPMPVQKHLFVINHMVLLLYLALITSLVIYQTDILFLHYLLVIQWYLNRLN